MERAETSKNIESYLRKGWQVEDAQDPVDPYYLVSPSGRVFRYEQTRLDRCTICDPWDFEAICIHAEEDLLEGDQAVELAKLVDGKR